MEKSLARAGLAGEEEAIVDGRGERGAAIRFARQGIGIGTARERVRAPAMDVQRLDAPPEVAAEQRDELVRGEVEEGGLARRLERGGLPAAEISLRSCGRPNGRK